MKYQQSCAAGEFFASDPGKHPSIGQQFRRFCTQLTIPSAFLLTAVFFWDKRLPLIIALK